MYRQIFDNFFTFHFISTNVPGSFFSLSKRAYVLGSRLWTSRTVTDVPTIACVHIAISITVGDFVLAAACFLAVICIHASDGVPAVDRVHAVASAPTLLSPLLILAPTFTGHCELQKFYTICAAHETFRYFELCSICLREGLGRSKPTTNPWNKHKQHNCGDFYYIQAILNRLL